MNDIDGARAAREARGAVGSRVSSSHTTAELAERAIKQYLAAESYREAPEPNEDEETQEVRENK